MLIRTYLAAFIFFLAASVFGQSPQRKPVPVLTIQNMGPGTVELNGPWQFRLGDDPRWASPSFDDSAWEHISAASPWGSQTHPGYTGYAWYRRHLEIGDFSGGKLDYALLIPPVDDAYEVYWNGVLIGHYGSLPPRPHWYYTTLFRTFPVPSPASGTLAIRVWKSPLLFVDSGTLGGLESAPLFGAAGAIADQVAAINSQLTQHFLYEYTLDILYGFVTVLSLLLWIRNRNAELFLWLSIFTATPVVLSVIQGLFNFPISYAWGRGLNQPLYVLNHISLWFLLLWLLRLNDNRMLVRWAKGLAIASLAAGVLDGMLAFFWGGAGPWMQNADAVLTLVIMVVEIFPFVIIALGMRHPLEPSRWAVALSALASQMIDTIADASAVGQRFTHWTLFDAIYTPLFVFHGVQFEAADLITMVLFVSILYAVYHYSAEQQARQTLLEREMQSAREIQHILIPDALPSLDGFALSSAYRPALEVGGDFFQVIQERQGSAIVAVGDVSGKGLKAAMNVSFIVGVLRSLADAGCSPVEMLEGLNRSLCGRLQGGFVTTVILRLHSNGSVTLANAGHLPPFLNQRELTLDGSLPLGLVPSAEYEEVSVLLHAGDQLALYTDGLVEARSETGELYGFDRLQSLFASRPSAQQATEVAVAFGQDDDITVLTLTRLAAGEQSTTSMVTPVLQPGMAGV